MHPTRTIFDLKNIDASWSLFLDRDGVINEETVGTYVLNWKEFVFTKDALKAFQIFSKKFGFVFIVSNQRGVGKGLMTEEDLTDIHNEMQKEVAAVGGSINKIYYCTDINDDCYNRKPNPGMAFQAKSDYPPIDFSKAIMVGNKPSDMTFGRSVGMLTVFVRTTNPQQVFPHPDIDLQFESLYAFAQAL